MEVVVEDRQLSLAIGKKGQNVRLAAKLSGWKIDIKSDEEKRREVEEQFGALAAEALAETEGVASEAEGEAIETEGGGGRRRSDRGPGRGWWRGAPGRRGVRGRRRSRRRTDERGRGRRHGAESAERPSPDGDAQQ